MPTPIEELVVANLISTLEGIAAPTYSTTVAKVIDYEAWDDDILRYPAVMLLVGSTAEDDSTFSDRQNVDLEFQLILVLDTWTNPRQAAAAFVADVKQALLTDVQRGGTARDTHITRTERFLYDTETGARAGAVVYGKVEYRHVRGNPYQQG